MAANEILTERRGQALIVTFNRPDHKNAMTLDMASQLFTVLKNTTTDPGVRAILMCGSGEHFIDGLDQSFYGKDVSSALEAANQFILPFHSAIRELQVMDKPVLAAVQGQVTGVGFGLMLAADLVIASSATVFRTGFVEHALPPIGGASFFLSRKVGMGRAMEILMLDEPFEAERAKRLRLINRIVDDNLIEQEALAWLDKLVAGPTKAYGAIKKLACTAFEKDINGQLGLEHTYFGHCSRSFDFREAVRAHSDKRDPRYTGT
ncbi:MAG: enoyl-CoA hydratase/isomerase family protein [Bdellovibrionales bacterium]